MLDYVIDLALEYIPSFLALLLVLPLHEFAHAFAAVKSGDITPKLYKRYTLNPFAHFDTLGLVCFVIVGFGWSKPVPVNPLNFKNYKKGCFFVSIAGVCANYLLAFVTYPLIFLSFFIPQFGYFTPIIQSTIVNIYFYSLVFFVFNLLPFYPLDGFRVIDVFNKKHGKVYCFLRDYGRHVLLVFFGLSLLADITGLYYLDVLGNVISICTGIIGYPISLFWGLFI